MKIVQILSMMVVGTSATILAIFVNTVYGIFILTADIVYVVIFPQFTCAVFVPHVNPYGSFVGFAVGTILRFGGGEPALSLEPFIKYPFYDENLGQLFPFKTLAMVASFVTIVTVSLLSKVLFERGILPHKLEISGKILNQPSKVQPKASTQSDPLSASYSKIYGSKTDALTADFLEQTWF